MSQKEKLLIRFLSLPTDFHYDELIKILGYFDFREIKTGKTSGSKVRFVNSDGKNIIMHMPHPTGIMKHYQLKQIKEILGL